MSRIIAIVAAALTLGAAACTDDTSAFALTTEHETAVVHSVATPRGYSTTVLALDGDRVIAAIELDVGERTATLSWANGGDGDVLILPDGYVRPTLEDWNLAAYVFYLLEAWRSAGAVDVELCHQNAAGAGCRGACGVDCDSCRTSWVCARNSAYCGGAGANLVWFKRYGCYKRPCCVTHDACYDACNTAAVPSACRRKCDSRALLDGCNLDDANGDTFLRVDAKPLSFFHPTGIPCTEEGAVTREQPATVAGPDATHHLIDGADPLCREAGIDQEAWEAEVMPNCPDDASCASCIWGA